MSKILGTRVHEANAAESDRSRAGPLKASRIRHAGQAGMYGVTEDRKEHKHGANHAAEQKTDGTPLQKGGVPAAPSGTATLLRLSPNHQFCPRPILAVTDFRHPRLSWLDGRCVQGPGTYSPRHG